MRFPVHITSTLLLSVFFLFELIFNIASSQNTMDDLIERGRMLYHAEPVGCWVCHGDTAQGRVGPTLQFGPTPTDIFEQLESNPTMSVIMTELNLNDNDLIALSIYLRTMAELPLEDTMPAQWREALVQAKTTRAQELVFSKTERDIAVEAIESFGSVITSWEQRANEGNLESHYDSRIVATFNPGTQKFKPQKNHIYFYENIGTNSKPA
ncbi:MAG: hypothetical protein P8M36_05550, partial [Gammaproteobacteria bacterium]|nr:hypothetical protein [Gammaproteobacteria bacterium]